MVTGAEGSSQQGSQDRNESLQVRVGNARRVTHGHNYEPVPRICLGMGLSDGWRLAIQQLGKYDPRRHVPQGHDNLGL
jgi:hypothetical protein